LWCVHVRVWKTLHMRVWAPHWNTLPQKINIVDNTEALEEVKYESARVKYESKFLDFVDPALLPTPKWIPALTDTDFSWCAPSFVLRSN
jgi:hypothetical protein